MLINVVAKRQKGKARANEQAVEYREEKTESVTRE